jgi:phosphatidylserine decarboxylase
MTIRARIQSIAAQEDLNFLLTNRIPRRLVTRLVGWFSAIEQPLVRDLSIALWRLFSDLDLSEARKSEFRSLRDCFTRELKPGARPLATDPAVLVSPCDGIVGACGAIAGNVLYQVKGSTYTLDELLVDSELARAFRDGRYVTLRLTASMYHRFHAPHDLRVERVVYLPGDAWNVNPVALKRIEKLYCKNERAVLRAKLAATGHVIALVPVAAILVAGIRLNFIDALLDLGHRGPDVLPCDAPLRKGEEMGWFQHGSTIIVFAPDGFTLCDNVRDGAVVRMGQPLLRLP